MDKTPYQALLHDGTFTNLDFQPGRDFVGCGGVVDMARLRTAYFNKLIASGIDQDEATLKVSQVRGAITLMTDQFVVMGLNRNIILEDKEQNKRAWELVGKVGNVYGQRVGAEPSAPRPRTVFVAEPLVRSGPKYVDVASLADSIGNRLDKGKGRKS